MNRRVLIVSPHFPPINAADHQRVRMSLPYLAEFGWDADVLTVRPSDIEGVPDPLLLQTVPPQIAVTHAKALPLRHTQRLGIGSLSWRCFPDLLRTGSRLLQQQRFDLVYVSTTVFAVMAIAARWQQRFGVPYVLDFQDPWRSDYYRQPDAPPPPGGRLKYGVAQLQARFLEPIAVRRASQIISVSPAYPKTLQQRYPRLQPDRFTVLPFGAPEADFELLPRLSVRQTVFNPQDGNRHWVYVGRGGGDMALALRTLFLAIATDRQQNPDAWRAIRLHFVGTSYASGDRAVKTVEPIAQEMGVADLVTEHVHRIPYFEALQVLRDSSAILLIGSNDAGYTASKLYPCVLARQPILAVFHRDSSVVGILRECQAGRAVTFTADSQPAALQSEMVAQLQWLRTLPPRTPPDTRWAAFQPYTARAMTRQQCAVFDRAIAERAKP